MQPTRTPSRERNCSVARTLDILGDPWSFLVLRAPFFRVRRFDDIQRELGIPRSMLSRRLEELVDTGLLEKRKYCHRPPRFEYCLTEAGLDLYGSILALMRWGDDWLAGRHDPPLALYHKRCGHRFHARVVCSACGEPVDPRQVTWHDGPGAGTSPRLAPRRRRAADTRIYRRGRPCSVARTLSLLGDRWTFLVLREIFFGATRFDEMQRALGIARNILADRLERLRRARILERRRYQQHPPRHEYHLTGRGLDLYACVIAMMRWGDDWLAGEGGLPLVLIHRNCGNEFQARVSCSACGDDPQPGDVSYEYTRPCSLNLSNAERLQHPGRTISGNRGETYNTKP